VIANVHVKKRDGKRFMGSKPVGLVVYLFGPGRANEHTGQRVIAAAPSLGITDGTRLDHRTQPEEIKALGLSLDAHRKAMGITLPRGHIWHCTLSLPPHDSTPERRLNDQEWAEIVRATMKKMGFDDGVQAPCRWLAVHHGQSAQGNEHVHLVVNLVREDGTTASLSNEKRKLSALCAEVEARYRLSKVEGRLGKDRRSVGNPDVSRAQIERSSREGKAETDQARLERTVRAALAVARNEAEFVRTLRELGVLVRPRYAPGGREEVVGYSVAVRPRPGYKTIWFGGGRLHRELTLTQLRQTHWPDDTPGQEGQAAARRAQADALAVWAGTGPDRILPSGARDSGAWRKSAVVLSEVRARLVAVPVDQPELWALAAREATGVLSMWSVRVEGARPRILAHAADVLARSAQFAQARADDLAHPGHSHGVRRPRRKDPRFDLRGVTMVVSTAAGHHDLNHGHLMLLRQLVRLIEAINQADRARGRALQAIHQAEATYGRLLQLQQHWTNVTEHPTGSPDINSPGLAPAPRPGPASRSIEEI
jgi:relaxase-like protein